jgi:hypothetical protein
MSSPHDVHIFAEPTWQVQRQLETFSYLHGNCLAHDTLRAVGEPELHPVPQPSVQICVACGVVEVEFANSVI